MGFRRNSLGLDTRRMASNEKLHELNFHLERCCIELSITRLGYGISSRRERFADFALHSEIESFEPEPGAYSVDGLLAHFPGAAVVSRFSKSGMLLAYPSGHIRWIPDPGFRYYATLSRGLPPDYCQGDLVVFNLDGDASLPDRAALEAMLPGDECSLWCKALPADPRSHVGWREAADLYVGGNTRHRALGRFRYMVPVRLDRRSAVVRTNAEVVIDHNPIDSIHPLIVLPPDRLFLVTKLPGFSDPAAEATACKAMLLT
jgi:hypothetical protein